MRDSEPSGVARPSLHSNHIRVLQQTGENAFLSCLLYFCLWQNMLILYLLHSLSNHFLFCCCVLCGGSTKKPTASLHPHHFLCACAYHIFPTTFCITNSVEPLGGNLVICLVAHQSLTWTLEINWSLIASQTQTRVTRFDLTWSRCPTNSRTSHGDLTLRRRTKLSSAWPSERKSGAQSPQWSSTQPSNSSQITVSQIFKI